MNAPSPGRALAAPAPATGPLPPEGEPFLPSGQIDRAGPPPGPDPAEGGGIHAASSFELPAVGQRNKVFFLS